MSTKSVTTITCDRCGRNEIVGSGRDPWGSVFVMLCKRTINNGGKDSDVCPDCIKDAMNWWNAPQQVQKLH